MRVWRYSLLSHGKSTLHLSFQHLKTTWILSHHSVTCYCRNRNVNVSRLMLQIVLYNERSSTSKPLMLDAAVQKG
jgi:hypothetical protein